MSFVVANNCLYIIFNLYLVCLDKLDNCATYMMNDTQFCDQEVAEDVCKVTCDLCTGTNFIAQKIF